MVYNPQMTEQQENTNELLEKYFAPRRNSSKFWLGVVTLVLLAGLVLLFKFAIVDNSMSGETLRSSVELFDISSQWVDRAKTSLDDPRGVIIVPEVSFRIRNIGKQELKYLYVLGVFRFVDNGRTIGEGYRMTLRDGLPPGGESERITLTCGFGYRASNARALQKNPQDWLDAMAEVFIQSRNSPMLALKTLYVSRKVAGIEFDIRLRDSLPPTASTAK